MYLGRFPMCRRTPKVDIFITPLFLQSPGELSFYSPNEVPSPFLLMPSSSMLEESLSQRLCVIWLLWAASHYPNDLMLSSGLLARPPVPTMSASARDMHDSPLRSHHPTTTPGEHSKLSPPFHIRTPRPLSHPPEFWQAPRFFSPNPISHVPCF